MEIHHKVKPLHGWREFLGEVGVIVLGVLIALGAEQVAQAIHWHRQVVEGQEALSRDLTGIFQQTKQRELLSKCLARRFRDMAGIINEAQRTGRLPPVGSIGAPGSGLYMLPSWNSLNAAGVAAHFPRDQLLAYGAISEAGRELTQLSVAEMQDWTRLYTMIGPGRPIGEAELGDLRAALSEANYRAQTMRIVNFQLKEAIKSVNMPLDPDFARQWPAQYAAIKRKAAASHLCQPLGPAPDHYGEMPGAQLLEMPLDQFR